MSSKWDNKNIFIVEAPTGYGKTTLTATLALYTLKNELKTIIVYPLRSLLEDQYKKFSKLLGEEDVLGKRYMHNPQSRYLIKPITLTTVDTLSLNLFGIPPEDLDKVVKKWSGTLTGSLGHYLFSWASTILSNIVLDEVHLLADQTKSLNFLFALMKIVIHNDQRLVLLTATLPKTLKDLILNDKIIEETVEIIEFDESIDPDFVHERLDKNYDIEIEALNMDEKFTRLTDVLKDYLNDNSDFKRFLIVFNTVRDAIEFYKLLQDKFPGIPKILLHSRFTEKDREKKISNLNEKISKCKRYLIVATQVVEAGIDISSDFLICEAAPANSLIQRMGRFLRFPGEKRGKIYIWFEVKDKNKELKSKGVYDTTLVRKTIDFLESIKKSSSRFNVHLPSHYKHFLNSVYSEEDFRANSGEVDELIRITFLLDRMSLAALEKLIELEGSFVRESFQISVIPEERLEQFLTGKLDFKDLIPLNYNLLEKLDKVKAIKAIKEHEHGKTTFEVKELYIKIPYGKLVEKIIKENIIALVAPISYDEDFGAVLDGLENSMKLKSINNEEERR